MSALLKFDEFPSRNGPEKHAGLMTLKQAPFLEEELQLLDLKPAVADPQGPAGHYINPSARYIASPIMPAENKPSSISPNPVCR
jgi:hypothetical protein